MEVLNLLLPQIIVLIQEYIDNAKIRVKLDGTV